MRKRLQGLAFDPKREGERITSFVRSEVKRLGREGVVIGLSGGLDSSTVAYICREALGRESILGLILPETDSDPGNTDDARTVARELGLTAKEIDLTPVLDTLGVYQLSLERMPKSRGFVEGFVRSF